MQQEIYIIDDTTELIEKLQGMFKDEKDFHFVSMPSDNIEIVLKNIPTMIIIDDDNTALTAVEICQRIRTNEDNSITPILITSSVLDHDYRMEILKLSVQYYIVKPIDEDYFYMTIKNMIDFVTTNRRVSPLTGLPGNVQIQAEIKKRVLSREEFAVVYLDLDNFKAYNDVYGFSNGDEIIKFTAKTIVKHVHEIPTGDNFVGHIGGDDFVAVISKYDYPKLCQDIIKEFDELVPNYYTEEDVERGYVEVANRRGIIEQFPIVSISIGVVEVEGGKYTSPLTIGEVSAQVKHKAKEIQGSTYVINRRKF
ncbi:MAG: GGDEF domain-containing response regulator [Clostridia bacterium]|nr:GGDEF domain-containing response regulator [Clostridia bacterium]